MQSNKGLIQVEIKIDSTYDLVKQFMSNDMIFNHFNACLLSLREFVKNNENIPKYSLNETQSMTSELWSLRPEVTSMEYAFIEFLHGDDKDNTLYVKVFKACYDSKTNSFNKYISKRMIEMSNNISEESECEIPSYNNLCMCLPDGSSILNKFYETFIKYYKENFE
jgi:hypothetical protein